jgi:ubiquinone/menaquinone biosynthesis C-methylase UbiE
VAIIGLYQRYIFPRLLDLAMRNKEVARYRAALVPRALGTALEVGVGSGLNLPFYGSAVERIYAVEPDEKLLAMARNNARAAAFPIEFLAHSGESLPLGDSCVDTVVATFTLCTIPDLQAALGEMKRVLKPHGLLLFAEHGLAPDPSVQRWQHRLNPVWKKWAGGCNLDRKMDVLIRKAGFDFLELRKGYAKGPKALSYIYSGVAQITRR